MTLPRRKIITDEEAKEAGCNKEVYQLWLDVMQAMWTSAILYFEGTGQDENLLPKQKDNEIFLGEVFKINAHMVNNKYVTVNLHVLEMEVMEIRANVDLTTMAKCIFMVIKAVH